MKNIFLEDEKNFYAIKIFFYIIKNFFHDEKSISTQLNIFFLQNEFFYNENLSLHVDHFFLHNEQYFSLRWKILFYTMINCVLWYEKSIFEKYGIDVVKFWTIKLYFMESFLGNVILGKITNVLDAWNWN